MRRPLVSVCGRVPPLLARLLITAAIVASATLVVARRTAALARGDDACPENNDDFQGACYLGSGSDVLGFISGPDDVDAYQFEAPDHGVQARIELAEMPAPYAFRVTDWRGAPIGDPTDQGMDQAAYVTLGPSGSCYVFVQSPSGRFDAGAPYRLASRLAYPSASVPDVRWSETFRTTDSVTGWNRSTEHADFVESDGKVIIRVKKEGIAQEWERVTSQVFGPPKAWTTSR